MKTLLAFLCLCSPAFAQYPYPMGGAALGSLERQTVQTEDEYRLADRLYARYLQRQAEALALQARAMEVEVSNQRWRDYVCQRFCGVQPAATLGYPAGYPATIPAGYPSQMQAGYGTGVQVGVGLRYPW